MTDLSDRRALVTGASSGIGAAVAHELAARGCALVLTARRRERLEDVAAAIRDRHDVPTTVVTGDLAAPDGAAAVYAAATEDGPLDVLVNNAGFGYHEAFAAADPTRLDAMLRLNVLALTDLAWRFVRAARERGGPAWLLNVSSIAAWQPVPGFSVYAASKSYVRDFSYALAAELRDTEITVTCLAPGGTETEFADVADLDLPPVARRSLMSAERCARVGVRALLHGRRLVVPGGLNKVNAFLTRLLPLRTTTWAAGKVLGPTPSERDGA